ncbi:hypothetical protein ACGF1Z_27155 [Streptomyces sp. NPDC048018]|uniref:hypothetical protein n=1 Tax=Streptomyces sp. NPDC048018 TaxID=3365499 RepID=UPI0037119222
MFVDPRYPCTSPSRGGSTGERPQSRTTSSCAIAYQAKSHLELKESEIAARTAGEALRLARRIGVPRCEALVQDLVPAFRQVSSAEGVEEFLALAAG